MRNIAIIPARSGSKGLKDKNIKLLNGKPLIWYSIQAALKSNCFDEVMVSTDSEKYAKISKECGASVPFLRSAEQSSDTAGSWDVVKEVIKNYQDRDKFFDTVCLLQPTSPLREAKDINGAYEVFVKKDADAVTSVCEVDHSPLWCMVLPEDDSLNEFRNGFQSGPRQKLSSYNRLNGSIYIRKIEYSDSEIIISDQNEFAYVMDRRKSVDIDTREDFEMAEYLIRKSGGGHQFVLTDVMHINQAKGWCAA